MERIQRKAFIGLVALSFAAIVPAMAQDTTTTGRAQQPKEPAFDSLTMPGQGGAADTAGYSGMERNDPSGQRAPGARQDTSGARRDTSGVETGAVRTDTSANAQRSDASAGQATTGGGAGQSRDPNGYKWTEPSDWARAGQTPPVGATDAVQHKQTDSMSMPGQGGAADTAGYAGMERDTSHQAKKGQKSDSTHKQ
jgi:hypothetical protein